MLNQRFFFPTTLRNTILQTESGTLMLKQSVINYKTLQTDGPSPVRSEHLNALEHLKWKHTCACTHLSYWENTLKKTWVGGFTIFCLPAWMPHNIQAVIPCFRVPLYTAFFFLDWKDFNTQQAEMRHCYSSRAVATSQSFPSPLNLSIIRPTPEEAVIEAHKLHCSACAEWQRAQTNMKSWKCHTHTDNPFWAPPSGDGGPIESHQRRQSLRHPVGHHGHRAEHCSNLQHGDTHVCFLWCSSASPALPSVDPWFQTARALNQPVRTLPQPEQPPSLPELAKYSYRSPAALVRSRGCWETGSGRAAHIQQHHAGIFPLRATASASPLPPLSLTLLLSLWLSFSFSLPLSFSGCRAVHRLSRSYVSSQSAFAART